MSEKKYDSETLERLQEILRMMLADFDKLCENNDIDYFLVGGSLLGAVRHNGMIPWDDDIDVGMTGENYDKFLQVMNNSQNEKYSLMSSEGNEKFPYLRSAGLMLNGTKFMAEIRSESEESYTTQIVLDILAFDNLADNERRAKIQGIKSFIYGKLSYLTTIENPTVHQAGIKLFFIKTTIKVFQKTFKLFKVTPKFFIKKGEGVARKYNSSQTQRVMYMNQSKMFSEIFDRNDLLPTRRVDFDGQKIEIPKETDKYLTAHYGDYMTLPPEDKRYNHYPAILDFGKYK